jgi:hypothetical protein
MFSSLLETNGYAYTLSQLFSLLEVYKPWWHSGHHSIHPEDIDTNLLADKRIIMFTYRGVEIKAQVHSVMEEIELRCWAKFKSCAAKAGSLTSLWCEAGLPRLQNPCPWSVYLFGGRVIIAAVGVALIGWSWSLAFSSHRFGCLRWLPDIVMRMLQLGVARLSV